MIKEFWNIKKPCGFVLEFLDSQKNTRVNQPQHKCRGFFLGLKKAQASDFMTWIITTLAIIVFISIVIFFVNFSFLKDAKVENYNSVRTSDFVVGESLLAYARTSETEGGENFYKSIKTAGNLDETKDNGKIAGLIFKNLYPEYSDSWFGFSYNDSAFLGSSTSILGKRSVPPFGMRPTPKVASHGGGVLVFNLFSVKINFEKEKFLEFVGRQK